MRLCLAPARIRALPQSLLVSLTMVAACSRTPEPAPAASAAPTSAQAPASPPPPMAGAAELGKEARAGNLAWEHRAPLVRRAPKSAMRAAEYGVEGDGASELSVFYFGPNQGGDVESNVQRWVGQLTPGADAAPPKRSTRNVGPIAVHLVEAGGAFGGGMGMPGMAAPAPIGDALLLGAIAEAPGAAGEGPVRVFFKLVGPRAAVDSARDAFAGLLDSLRVVAP